MSPRNRLPHRARNGHAYGSGGGRSTTRLAGQITDRSEVRGCGGGCAGSLRRPGGPQTAVILIVAMHYSSTLLDFAAHSPEDAKATESVILRAQQARTEGTLPLQAGQARPEPPQQSHSVTKVAATGQLLMAASGQVPMTANNPASIKRGYLQDAPRGHTVYLPVYRESPSRPRVLTGRGSECGLMPSRVSPEPRASCAR